MRHARGTRGSSAVGYGVRTTRMGLAMNYNGNAGNATALQQYDPRRALFIQMGITLKRPSRWITSIKEEDPSRQQSSNKHKRATLRARHASEGG